MASGNSKKFTACFIKIKIIDSRLSMEDLGDILDLSIFRNNDGVKVEESNSDTRTMVLGFPFTISVKKVMSVITQNIKLPINVMLKITKDGNYEDDSILNAKKKLLAKYCNNDDGAGGSDKGVFKCNPCNQSFNNVRDWRLHQLKRSHLLKTIKSCEDYKNLGYYILNGKTAFKNRISTIIFVNRDPEFTINEFLNKIKNPFTEYLILSLETIMSIKVNCNLFANYKKISGEEKIFNLNTSNVTFYKNDEILKKIEDEIFPQFDIQNDEFNREGSGWIYNSTSEMEVRICKNDVMKKGGAFIQTPNSLKFKKALINVKNDDEKCFYYSIFSRFVKSHPNNVQSYKYIETILKKKQNIKFDFTNINFPATLIDIKKFEKNNLNVSINVYIYEKKKIAPIKVCEMEKNLHYDLLMLKQNDKNFHYVWIKNFSRLVSAQLTKDQHAVEVCKRCLVHYTGKNRLQKLIDHKKYCSDKSVKIPSKTELPTGENEDNILKYRNIQYETPLTYLVFADFETMLIPVESADKNDGDDDRKTRKLQRHDPIAFCYYLINSTVFETQLSGKIKKPKDPVCYVGKNAATIFFKMIKEVGYECERKYKKYEHLNRFEFETQAQIEQFENDPKCCLCLCQFKSEEKSVIHHCHLTNKVIGRAHSKCNLYAKVPNFLPVFVHNLSKYDSHLILHGYKKDTARDIRVIANSEETYISFSKKIASNFWIRFVDSYRFLSSSLSKLVDMLPKSELFHTNSYFWEPEKFDLICKKGYFCYDYLNNEEKLKQTKIPTKSDFDNALTMEKMGDESYEFVKKVWNTFKCRNLEDYLVTYVISDTLLLADVFMSFRKISLQTYKLDPCYFYSLPGYAFQAMLKVTGVEFELFTDINMYLFFERALRGGITNTITKYAEANNVHVPQYDPKKPPCSLFYTDCNNLYGHSMGYNKLPLRNFKWVPKDELSKFTSDYILNIADDSDVGYYLEVDLDYPTHLHTFHNAFPFAPEKKIPPHSKTPKLLCTLENKTNYVLHYRNLKLCLRHGLVLKNIHNIIQFHQENFLEPFINLNTSMRKKAKSNFETDFYKLCNNSTFGKMIENQRNYMNFKLVCNEKSLMKSISKPSYKNCVIFSENLVGIHFHKSVIKLNKPIYAGVTVLELSRNFMYQFYYEDLKKIFHDLEFPELLYMDTDSFILSLKTYDIYPYIRNNWKYFDTSNYPPNHFCFSDFNKKTPGFFKDEIVYPNQIVRYISLCPKVYSLDLLNELKEIKSKEIKKAKGVKSEIVKKEVHFSDFYACLFDNISLDKKQLHFQSKKHQIFTIEQNKRALMNYCDKRDFYNNLNSRAFGHFEISADDNMN